MTNKITGKCTNHLVTPALVTFTQSSVYKPCFSTATFDPRGGKEVKKSKMANLPSETKWFFFFSTKIDCLSRSPIKCFLWGSWRVWLFPPLGRRVHRSWWIIRHFYFTFTAEYCLLIVSFVCYARRDTWRLSGSRSSSKSENEPAVLCNTPKHTESPTTSLGC